MNREEARYYLSEEQINTIEQAFKPKPTDDATLRDIFCMGCEYKEQEPCNTCGYEEGSIYCKEHCPHEAKIDQESCDNAISRQDVLDLAKKGVLISNGNYKSVCKAINELPSVNPQPCGDAIDRKLVCAFIAGLISDDGERKKGLEYIRNMPPVNPQPCQEKWIDEDDNRYICKECEYAHKPQEEPCEDAISRQAVCKIIDDIRDCVSVNGYWAFLERLKKLPSVNPTKTGHWIAHSDGIWIKYYECSRCGKIHNTQSDYCEKCGAKMVEPQESEE